MRLLGVQEVAGSNPVDSTVSTRCSEAWYRTWFGTKGSLVQIQSPRLQQCASSSCGRAWYALPMKTQTVVCGCGRVYEYNRAHRHGHSRTKCNSCLVNGRREGTKRWAVEYKGGKCSRCGYCRSLRALSFHHRDPKKKDLSLNSSNFARSRKVLQKELDKCDLLCANCHMEEHERLEQPPKALG